MSAVTITVNKPTGTVVIQGSGPTQTVNLSTGETQVVQLGTLSAAVNQQITQAVSASAASAAAAADSATAATGSASAAATSAASASSSASSASTSASTATTQAGNAATSAGAASVSATNAAGSASSASTSASSATTQATNAANSATAAASSATASANAYSAIANAAAPDAGTLTGTEDFPLSRGAGLLQTTLTKILNFVLGQRDLASYAALRAYTGSLTRIGITGAGIAGQFAQLASASGVTDDGGVNIIDAQGRAWRRLFFGDVYADWFGTVADGVTDDSTPIQNACNYLGSAIPYGGVVRLSAKKTYAIGTSIKLSRGVSVRGFSKDSTVLQLLGNNAGFEQIIVNGAGALNCGVSDLQIKGTGNATLTGQYGIVGSSSLQYSTFERILITNTGGNGIYLPGTGLGAIYNSFRDIEITLCQGYGIYMSGGTAQCRFERVRYINGYSHGIVFEGFAGQLIPFNNIFDTCGCELTNNTTTDIYGVWFKSATTYNAYATTFINCYIEPDSQLEPGNSAAYRISAANGVRIIGGMASQCHWGVLADGQYANGIEVAGVFFNNSPAWAGNANLAGKSMIAATASGASINVGPQCTAQVTGTGVTWNTYSAANGGAVYGYLGFQSGLGASTPSVLTPNGTTANKPAAVAALRGQFYYTQQPTGQSVSDLLEVCVKKADDTYAWRSVGGIQNASGTFSFGGTTVAAGATVSLTVGANGASTGRVVNVGPSVSLAGLMMTANGETGSVIRLTFYNPTASSITLASGTWLYEVIGV